MGVVKVGPAGTAAKFKEYACAVAGSPQELARIGNERMREVVVSPFAPTCPDAGRWTRMRAKVSDGSFWVPRYLTLPQEAYRR
jgi:hypothetical protein